MFSAVFDRADNICALTNFMGAHERAVLAVAENIAAGRLNPLESVVEILHFPLTKPKNSTLGIHN